MKDVIFCDDGTGKTSTNLEIGDIIYVPIFDDYNGDDLLKDFVNSTALNGLLIVTNVDINSENINVEGYGHGIDFNIIDKIITKKCNRSYITQSENIICDNMGFNYDIESKNDGSLILNSISNNSCCMPIGAYFKNINDLKLYFSK